MTNPTDIGECRALAATVGHQKVASPGSTTYEDALHSYFSTQQASMQPSCIVFPQSAQDVSSAVKSLVQLQGDDRTCQFAVRSGGHTSWAEASNIDFGAVMDLRSVNTIELAADKSTVSVGMGAVWGEVYKELEPHGLSVNGGRASTVGVGGLTLGSGVSYTSPQYGWTCDSAVQFQIVLADGSVVIAHATTRPDLFRALKGGGNNFGIVTRITFETFEQGPVWSGTIYSLDSAAKAVIENFVNFNSATNYDKYASVMTSFVYNQARGMPVISNLLQYTKEVSGIPEAFESFMSLPNIYSSTSVANIYATTEATAALNSGGVRSLTYSVTVSSTKEVIQAACDKWRSHYPVIKDVPSIIFSLVLEPLPPIMYRRHATSNVLGLADRTEALVIVELSVSWATASDDALVNHTARALVQGIIADAKELGGYDPYIFANYANKDQSLDVIGSYGPESVAFIRKIRQEVDPKGVFSSMVPGGYKIPDK